MRLTYHELAARQALYLPFLIFFFCYNFNMRRIYAHRKAANMVPMVPSGAALAAQHFGRKAVRPNDF
jgi:hypothetical protein